MSRLVVIGAGMAGVASAWAAVRAGFQVELLDGGGGATELSCGALDLLPWPDATVGSREAVPEEWSAFIADLGLYRAGPCDPRVVTLAGITRSCAYADPLLLDLGSLEKARVGVAALQRPEWDPERMCWSLQDEPWSKSRELVYQPWPLPGVFEPQDLRAPLPVFAQIALERQEQLAGLVREAKRSGEIDALLLGPWLGTDASSAGNIVGEDRFSGEATGPPEGGAGRRLANANRQLLRKFGVKLTRARAQSVTAEGAKVLVSVQEHEGVRAERLEQADACIIATGGLVGGGRWLSAGRRSGGKLELMLAIGTEGISGSHDGLDPSATAPQWLWPGSLETSLRPQPAAAWNSPRIQLAGDVIPGAPQTLGGAIMSGLTATSAVCRFA